MRRLLLAVLLLCYIALFVQLPSFRVSGRAFDPLEPRGRQVERDIESGRFAEALPIARELVNEHPDDATVHHWLAEIYRGVGQSRAEAQAWERVLEVSHAADAACPGLPEAYSRDNDREKALDAYRRCALAGPDDAERWFDLGAALNRAGREAEASDAFDTSRALDPSNPRLPAPETALNRRSVAP